MGVPAALWVRVLCSIVHLRKSTTSRKSGLPPSSEDLSEEGESTVNIFSGVSNHLPASHVSGLAPDFPSQGPDVSIIGQPWMSIQTTLELYNSKYQILNLLGYVCSSTAGEKDLFESYK